MAMTHLQKLKILPVSKIPIGSSRSHIRFYGKRNAKGLCEKPYVKEAQSALFEYLHYTRRLQYMDAEHMSKNSPLFLEHLLARMGSSKEVDIGRSLTRFLMFHPINEFESLFESMGLKPKEQHCAAYLPRHMIYLNDDPLFMNNYYVLCNYGVRRSKMGRIYMEARPVFSYDEGVLQSKLMSFGEVGLKKPMVVKLVVSCPSVLIESGYNDFFQLLKKLRGIGIAYDWIESCILKEGSCCKWRNMLRLVCVLSNMGCSEEQLQSLIRMHPKLLCESSAQSSFSIISLLTKFGCTSEGICTMLLQFPQVPVSRFLTNLRSCYSFLVAVQMDPPHIGNIVCSHALLLGSCHVKTYKSVVNSLCAGNKKTLQLVKENPQVLKSWVYGKKIERISIEEDKSYDMKVKFLVDIGFAENSKELNRAITMFRGSGKELQERFDCFVQAGFNPIEVKKMVKSSPQILNQTKDSITTKIDFLVNHMDYPLSSLLAFPIYIAYGTRRAKLRLALYNWLKAEGAVDGKIALSTIVGISDARFMKKYVKSHPKGPEFWENLKKHVYPA